MRARARAEAQPFLRVEIRSADFELGRTAKSTRDDGNPGTAAHGLDFGMAAARVGVGVERARVRRERLVERINHRIQAKAETNREGLRFGGAQLEGEDRRAARQSVVRDILRADHGDFLGQQDGVAKIRTFHQQDVGGVIIEHVGPEVIAVVPVEVVPEETVVRRGVELDHVNAFTAIEIVVAILAFEPVGIRPAPERVVAAAAEELIFTRPAEYLVVAAQSVRVRIDRVSARVEPVAGDELRAAVTENHLATDAAVDPVRARAAVHLAAGEQRLRLQLGGCRGAGRVRVAVEEVHAVATPESLARERAGAAIAEQPVAARAAIHLILPRARLGVNGRAVEGLEASVEVEIAAQDVVVVPAQHHVMVRAAEQKVVVHATVEVVIALAAVEAVDVATAEEPVRVGAAEQHVPTVRHVALDRFARESPRGEQRRAEAGGMIRLGRREERRQVEFGGALGVVGKPEVRLGQRFRAAPNHVHPAFTEQQVVAHAADEQIISRTTEQDVVSASAVETIRAAGHGERRLDAVEGTGLFKSRARELHHRGEGRDLRERDLRVVTQQHIHTAVRFAAIQDVAAEATDQNVRTEIDAGEERIAVFSVVSARGGRVQHIVAAVRREQALHEDDRADPVEGDVRAIAKEDVGSAHAGNDVATHARRVSPAAAADDDVRRGTARDPVPAAEGGIRGIEIAVGARHGDASVVTEDPMRRDLQAGVNRVVARAAEDQVVAGGGRMIHQRTAERHVINQIVAAELRLPRLHLKERTRRIAIKVAAVTKQDVIAAIAIDDVVAGAAHDHIPAGAALDAIRAAEGAVLRVDVVDVRAGEIGLDEREAAGQHAVVADQDVALDRVAAADLVVTRAAEHHVAALVAGEVNVVVAAEGRVGSLDA